ncbi:Hypothetical protein EHI5A_046520 [Entamoeba histolytica KU27]|uniref:Uncharacterized protein n=1 Tax=Entamoeba histolytica KU27 TaxID=885311 RepID=M2S0P5_ENTHI|nr:Hypothetical protein EHI5A_046520 [Entamoeba histolytica KU27]
MVKKLLSKLFSYTFTYNDEFTIEGGEQSLTEQYRFIHENENFFLQVRNISIKETVNDIIINELQSFGFVGPSDSLSVIGEWKDIIIPFKLKVFFYSKQTQEAKMGILFFEYNKVFFELMSTTFISFDELTEILKGIDLSNVKQSHKLILNGVVTQTIYKEDFKVRVPNHFKRNGVFYTGTIQIYDDDIINTINLSFGKDIVSSEKIFKKRIEQMWGSIQTTSITLNCNSISWIILSFISPNNIYGVKNHYLAYHQYNNAFYSVWFGLLHENANITPLFTLILSNYSHEQLILKDKFPLYLHFNPEYSISLSPSFLPINSADEYGLISDILPSMFIDKQAICRFFINVTPLTGIPKETGLDIINMERLNLKNQKTTQMISQKTEKYGKYDCWCDICKTKIQNDEVKCMIKYVYFKNPDVYVRFSFSAPEQTFNECYINHHIPQLMGSLDLSLLKSN